MIILTLHVPALDTPEAGMTMAACAVVGLVVAVVFWMVALYFGY